MGKHLLLQEAFPFADIIHHRIIMKSFVLEGIFKGQLVQLPYNEQGHLQLDILRILLSLTLNVYKDEASTIYSWTSRFFIVLWN